MSRTAGTCCFLFFIRPTLFLFCTIRAVVGINWRFIRRQKAGNSVYARNLLRDKQFENVLVTYTRSQKSEFPSVA
jgi:hypothetical protein